MLISPATRRGFTLIELLVVIAIIGTLIAMLVPAVQKVRAAAARTECSNKLHQLVLACHNYHDTRRKLPAAVTTSAGGVAPTAGTSGPGWTVRLLPYVEQQALYSSFDVQAGSFFGLTPSILPPDSTANQSAAQKQRLTLYECPSDPNNNGQNYNLNYFACMGGGASSSSAGIYAHSTVFPMRMMSDNGAMYVNSSTRLTDVVDGTSNVFLLGESRYLQLVGGSATFYGTWASGYYFAANDTIDKAQFPPTAAIAMNGVNSSPLNPGNQTTWEVQTITFGSWHDGGAFFAMCDGSVQFIGNGIDINVYRMLGNRIDGGTLP